MISLFFRTKPQQKHSCHAYFWSSNNNGVSYYSDKTINMNTQVSEKKNMLEITQQS